LCRKASKGRKRSIEFRNKVSLGMKKFLSDNPAYLNNRLKQLEIIRNDKNIQVRRSKKISKIMIRQWKENKEYRELMIKIGKQRTGELSSNWRGGKSFEPYCPNFNEQIKAKIRTRDNFICQLCGIPELECYENLHIHHIDYNKKNSNENNLISLCRKCHVRTNFRREYWIKTFNQMLYAR
jgi:hypothetical protein